MAGLTALSVLPSIDQVKYFGDQLCAAFPVGVQCKVILAIILFALGIWGRETAAETELRGIVKSS